MAELLSARAVTLSFGGVDALTAVDLAVDARRISGLIGPNGAGKTSLLNCICRFYRPRSGQIEFDGRNLMKMGSHQLAGLGIARTFQHLELFASMTVLENVMVGAHTRGRQGTVAGRLGWPPGATSVRQATIARNALDLVGLTHRAGSSVGALPLGEQKRVSMARALACEPRLLLLDEPASGMNDLQKQELARLLQELRDRLDLTILLIEHDMDLVMSLCEHLTVLDFGRTIATGSPAEVRSNAAVITAYLGTAGSREVAHAGGRRGEALI